MTLRDALAEAEAHLESRPSAGALAARAWHARRAILLHEIADRPPARLSGRLALAAFAIRLAMDGTPLDSPALRVAMAALAGLDAELDRLDLALVVA